VGTAGGGLRHVLHSPDSRPTLKQLESLLKEADNTAVGIDVSMGPRTFMLPVELIPKSRPQRWIRVGVGEAAISRGRKSAGVVVK
jgi:hypothetical protein